MRIHLPHNIAKLTENAIAIRTEPERLSDEMLNVIQSEEEYLRSCYDEIAETPLSLERNEELIGRVNSYKRATVNFAKAAIRTSSITDELNTRRKESFKGNRRLKVLPAPSNAVIDLEELRTNHFARGLSWYKLVLLFLIGSFSGVIIETLWCLLRYGVLMNRTGMVIGPFNGLYGLGAMVLTAVLYRYRNHGTWLSFLGGAVSGTVLEYLCSFFQELFLGSRSWDYSNMPFNVNGRVCLLYSIFWGLLGILWMKSLYPRTAELILKIPNRFGRVFTKIVFIFFIINLSFTALSVYRWSQRVTEQARPLVFWTVFDKMLPDKTMEWLFPSMKFGK
ncbi:MAG: putative ABC transporter permease [Spirochaetales bacterium]|nr:putative ABC transporter permease [Spirochaetales bacterium]